VASTILQLLQGLGICIVSSRYTLPNHKFHIQISQSFTYCLPPFVLAVLYFYPGDHVDIPLSFRHFLRWIFEGRCPWKPLASLFHRIWLPEHVQTWCRIWTIYGRSKNSPLLVCVSPIWRFDLVLWPCCYPFTRKRYDRSWPIRPYDQSRIC